MAADRCRLDTGNQVVILIGIISDGYIFSNRRVTGSTYIRPCLRAYGNIIIAGYISARLGADGNIMLSIHILSGLVTNRHMRALRSQCITGHVFTGTDTDRHGLDSFRTSFVTDSNGIGTGCLTGISDSDCIFPFCLCPLSDRYGIFSFGKSRCTGCQAVLPIGSRFFADSRRGFLAGLGTVADSDRAVAVFGNGSTIPDRHGIVRSHCPGLRSDGHAVVIQRGIGAVIFNNGTIPQRNGRISTGIGIIPDRHAVLPAAYNYSTSISICRHTAERSANRIRSDGYTISRAAGVPGIISYRYGIMGVRCGLDPYRNSPFSVSCRFRLYAHYHRIFAGSFGLGSYRNSIRPCRRSIFSGRIGTKILNARPIGIKAYLSRQRFQCIDLCSVSINVSNVCINLSGISVDFCFVFTDFGCVGIDFTGISIHFRV